MEYAPIYEKATGFMEPEDQDYYLLAKNGLFFETNSRSEIVFSPVGNRKLGWLEPQIQERPGFFDSMFRFWGIFAGKTETDKTPRKKGGSKLFDIYQKIKGFEPPEDQIYYLLAKNGLFLIKKTLFFTSSVPVFSSKENKGLKWLEPHEAEIELTLPKKIAFEDIKRVTEFFRRVWMKYHGSEAIVLVYWDEKNQKYRFIVPKQEVGGNVRYDLGKVPEGLIKFGDIHSHGSGDAFHSPHDDKDERHDDGIHITIGNVNFGPSISCSAVSDGMRATFEPHSIIDIGEVDIPKEWMSSVSDYAPPHVIPKFVGEGAFRTVTPTKGFRRKG